MTTPPAGTHPESDMARIFVCAVHGREYRSITEKSALCPICGYPMEIESDIP
jgi:hypothetical protein